MEGREKFFPEETFSFEKWKQHLESAGSIQEFVIAFEKIQNFEDPRIQEYIFGEGGVLEKFSQKEAELPFTDDWVDGWTSNHDDHTPRGIFFKILGEKILEAQKQGSLNQANLVVFVQELPKMYEEKYKIRLKEEQYSLEHTYEWGTDEKWGTPERWSQSHQDTVASFSEDAWKDQETYSTDPYDRLDIQDFENENHLYFARDFFRLCGEQRLTETIPALFEITTYAMTGRLNSAVVEAFNAMGSYEASQFLLEKVRDQKVPEREKNVAGRLLYLLEMGRIEVSEGTVEYLSKKYHLQGENKDAVVSAIRITPDGKLGLFDANNTLLNYIKFGDFENAGESEAQMMEVSTELLLSRTAVSAEEKDLLDVDKEDFLRDYHKVFFENFIAAETAVRVNNLSLREQFWFYKFLKSHEGEEIQTQVVAAAKKCGEAFIKTFIALQFDAAAGEKIVSIAEQYEAQEAKKIFDTYAELAQSADQIDEELAELFFHPPVGVKPHKATEEVMKKAGELLTGFVGKNEDPKQVQETLKKVGGIHADMVVFATLFKMAFKGKKETGLHQVRDMTFGSREGLQLTDEVKTEMVRIARENYADEPHVAEGLEELLHDTEALTKNEFIILSRQREGKNQLLSFLRVEKKSPDRVYVGGFNVNADVRGSGIGEQMLLNTLQTLRRDSTIEAVAVPELLAGTHYIESSDFVAKRFNSDTVATGTFHGLLEIEIDHDAPEYALRKKDIDLQRLYTEQFAGTDPIEHIGESIIVAQCDMVQDIQSATALFDRLLNHEGYHMVRAIALDKMGNKRLYGFERVAQAVEVPLEAAA